MHNIDDTAFYTKTALLSPSLKCKIPGTHPQFHAGRFDIKYDTARIDGPTEKHDV